MSGTVERPLAVLVSRLTVAVLRGVYSEWLAERGFGYDDWFCFKMQGYSIVHVF